MIALLKYGNGFPFYRLESLQGSVGIPLPTSTQWDIVRDFYWHVYPAFDELIRQAAGAKVIHNDDTTMKILSRYANYAPPTPSPTINIPSVFSLRSSTTNKNRLRIVAARTTLFSLPVLLFFLFVWNRQLNEIVLLFA